MARVIAHRDLDGLASAILLGFQAESMDFDEVPRKPLKDTLAIEVYHAENVGEGFAAIDHHKPKIGRHAWSLEAYVIAGGRIVWRSRKRTYSMVSGVRAISAAMPKLARHLSQWLEHSAGVALPPKWYEELADTLDNAVPPPRHALRKLGIDVDPKEALLAVFRYDAVDKHLSPRELALMPPAERMIALADATREYIEAALDSPEPPEPRSSVACGWLVYFGDRGAVKYHALLAQLRGADRVAYAWRGKRGWTVVVWSRGPEALRVAEAAGGGGRKSVRGYIAGYQASSIDEALARLCAVGVGSH